MKANEPRQHGLVQAALRTACTGRLRGTLGFKESMKLRVFASLSEDINNGWVWLPESIVPKRIVVKLRNLDSKKSVYCEALPIGKNFVTRYNNGVIQQWGQVLQDHIRMNSLSD